MGKGQVIGQYYTKGNTKLSKNTLIFNMGSAKDCPSKKLGLCKVCKDCYARKAEVQYPQVLPFRNRQRYYWNVQGPWPMIADLSKILFRRKKTIKYFRYNEAGDFETQRDVDKLSEVAQFLFEMYGIVTYGYTARSDLDFSKVKFVVRGSGWKGPNGKTRVAKKTNLKLTKKEFLCPMKGCGDTCFLCMQKDKIDIVFPKH